MARKRAVGEGTIYRRKDGRWEVALTCLTTASTRKRIRVYTATRAEAAERLIELQRQVQQGTPVPDKSWKLGAYLDYWLEDFVRHKRRLTTYELYESVIRLYLKPGLGGYSLQQLRVPILQRYFDLQLTAGHSLRKVQVMRTVLSAALTRAMKEELVTRNAARLVELETWERGEIRPWTVDEAARFLEVARSDRLYPAFLLLVTYGLRRGEVLGLRWKDVDLAAGTIQVCQQLQRIAGELRRGEVKTKAGRRVLPILAFVESALILHRAQQEQLRVEAGRTWQGDRDAELVFTTALGGPIDPRNFVRSYDRVCETYGIRRIKVHHIRHTVSTFMKSLRVPGRDKQSILGHSRVSTTENVYEHDSLEDRRNALEGVAAMVRGGRSDDGSTGLGDCHQNAVRCRQSQPSSQSWTVDNRFTYSGGALGIRTPDLLRAISIGAAISERIQEVDTALRVHTRRWHIGIVAVNSSRQAQLVSHASRVRNVPASAFAIHGVRCTPSHRPMHAQRRAH